MGIYKSLFSDNEIDLNAYKKNWQYGGGGNINLLDRSLDLFQGNVSIDKHSSLYVYEISEINSEIENDKIFLFNLENKYFKNNSIQNTLDSWGESY